LIVFIIETVYSKEIVFVYLSTAQQYNEIRRDEEKREEEIGIELDFSSVGVDI
jgi:hypothetical protein